MTKEPKRVLLVAHDRGGVNQLVPLLSRWQEPDSGIQAAFLSTPMIEWEVAGMIGTGAAPARQGSSNEFAPRPLKMKASNESFIGRSAWTFSDAHLRGVLQQGWDLVLTGTSMLSRLETSVWRICHEMAIPCAAICDMWSEYRRRVIDDQGQAPLGLLLVIDERMEQEAKKALGGSIPIRTVGSPHFDRLIRSSKVKQESRANIRFISEPVAALFPDTGLHEFYVAEMLISARDRISSDTRIVLRPHPQDDSEAWRRFVYDHRNRNVQLDEEPSWVCQSSTSMALGMSSMMLIELAMAGVPVASFQPPSADKSFFCLNEAEFGIRIVSDVTEFDAWLSAPEPPSVSEAFLRRHATAIEHITALVRDGLLLN